MKDMNDITIFEKLCSKDPKNISNLTLAYLGDSIYELYMRLYVLGNCSENIKGLHRKVIKAVSATGQANSFRKISDILTEKELQIFKRGRNTHTSSMSKNANPADYQTATGVEALIGYLYIEGNYERVELIMKKMAETAFDDEILKEV